MKNVLVLHPANTTPSMTKSLIGSMPGYYLIFPQAKHNLRWDHLGDDDVPALMDIEADYICGYSSGAFMASRMLQEKQYKAAMLLAGGILGSYLRRPLPHPCPIMLCHGTADKQVPYDGVPYAYEAGLDAALALKKLLNVTAGQTGAQIPPGPANDGCRAYYDDWGGKVRLFTVVNGGHTWPGSPYNALGLGRTCMDFSLTEKTAAFYGEHP